MNSPQPLSAPPTLYTHLFDQEFLLSHTYSPPSPLYYVTTLYTYLFILAF